MRGSTYYVNSLTTAQKAAMGATTSEGVTTQLGTAAAGTASLIEAAVDNLTITRS